MAAEDGSNVRIGRADATVTMTDGRSLLSPELMDAIVAAVLRAQEARESGRRRQQSDTRIGGGCEGDEA
jgi:hypothetical protein